MTYQPSMIVGAGLAGLIAAHAWPQVPIVEASLKPREEHKALLRFRSDNVAKLTGIEFKRVTVRKGLWSRGAFCSPTIALANAYATKVVGYLAGDRSVWSLDPAERWIAPQSFYHQLLDNASGRIDWGNQIDFNVPARGAVNRPILSTAPMPAVLSALGLGQPEFRRASIDVLRYRVLNADVFQTVYFPDHDLNVYRASITGDLLIIEMVRHLTGDILAAMTDRDMAAVFGAFGINSDMLVFEDRSYQHYGKIVPLQDEVRKSILFKLTHNHGILSLGRFATWRNILLDDVVDDIAVIKRLLRTGVEKYDLARARAAE